MPLYEFLLRAVNELVALLEQASAKIDITSEQCVRVGTAAIDLLHSLWKIAAEAADYQGRQLTGLAAARVIPIIAKLYGVFPEAAREVLGEILGRLGNPKASASEAYWVANNINSVIETDPRFAGSIFRRVFSHEELSEETTEKGGPVFSLTSTRAQDFSMTHYILDLKARPSGDWYRGPWERRRTTDAPR